MRGLKVHVILALCLGAFALSGCGPQDLFKPPKIRYGRDVCAQCRMIIQEERFACAVVSAEGRALKFDDVGCLAAYKKDSDGRTERSWVHDTGSGGWLEEDRATFVYSRDLVTPMGHGFAAFGDPNAAKRYARDSAGRLVSWDELSVLVQE